MLFFCLSRGKKLKNLFQPYRILVVLISAGLTLLAGQSAPRNKVSMAFPLKSPKKNKNDIGTHGQVQGRLLVWVVPVGVNLRALQLCSNLRYVICYSGGARGRWRHKEINHANFMGCKNMPTDKIRHSLSSLSGP